MIKKTLKLTGFLMILFFMISCVSNDHVAKKTIESGEIPPAIKLRILS